MYINSAYLNNSLVDFMDKSKPLIVGSCGTYHYTRIPVCQPTVPRADSTFKFYMLPPGKHIFILMMMARTLWYMLEIWWSTAQKSLRNMNILASTRQRSTGFILQEVISRICCAVTASQMRCTSSTLELRWNTRVFSNR